MPSTSIMGSSWRRLKIYYINNFKPSKLIWLLVVGLVTYFLVASIFKKGGKEQTLSVRYRHDTVEHRMNDDEVKQYLDALQDTRPVRCRDQAYDFQRLDVPETVSILMEFHGDEFYELKLTLNSIFEHTPYEIFQEIIILDDGTTDAGIRKHASSYLHDKKFAKVKMYRSEVRDGQAASRFKASMVASGSILVFVSSSVIVNVGWLQPLIAKVALNGELVAVPHFDNMLPGVRFFHIDDNLLNILTWTLSTVYYESSQHQNEELVDSPVMRGDVLAVKKAFLTTIGNFDEHMKGASGHNLELSLRLWMCGGVIKVETCSRVAVHSSLRTQHVTESVSYRRIVELWFDDFKEVVYRQGSVSSTFTEEESRSIQERRTYLQKQVPNCKPFNWYLNNIATAIFPPSDSMALFGKVKVKTNYCLRSQSPAEGVVDMTLCRQYMYERSAIFEMNRDGIIFKGDQCLETNDEDRAELRPCEDDNPNQKWRLQDKKLSQVTKPNKCLTQVTERDQETMDLYHFAKLMNCDEGETRKERWEFINY